MTPNRTLYLLLFILVITFKAFAQDDVKNYREPEVSEGSNLFIAANPSYENEKHLYFSDTLSSFNLRIFSDATYLKWKFTPKFNYSFISSVQSRYQKSGGQQLLLEDLPEDNTYTTNAFDLTLRGGASYYIIKNKLYFGSYMNTGSSFSNFAKPSEFLSLYPNIGYGKIVNAFIVTQTDNFENILRKENYISGKLKNSDKTELNAILDRRNYSEFTTKYRDNSDVEFFTELETLLLNKGIISKPLNARTTMELFQSLTDQNYIYFPRFKGFQIQAEIDQSFYNSEGIHSKAIFNLSSVYALPFSIKFGMIGSAFLAVPFKYNDNFGLYDFSFHSPLVIQDEMQLRKFSDDLIPNALRLGYNENYSYMTGFNLSAYYYISNKAGLRPSAEIIFGRNSNKMTQYYINLNTTFLYNVISKLNIYTSLSFQKDYFSIYSYFINSGISYYIF